MKCFSGRGKLILNFFALIMVIGCDSTQTSKTLILISGSSTIAPLMSEIAKVYEKKNPNTRVEVQSGGSSKGMIEVRQGNADIGMVSRKLKNTENDLTPIKIAIDGLAIIVHDSNHLKNVSRQNIIDIYLGNISNWKQVGGVDKEIITVNKAEGRSTLDVFTKYFGMKSKNIQADIIIGDNQQGIQTVIGNPHAIAYVSIGTAEYERNQNNAPIKLLSLDGVEASTLNVKNNTYPISRELNLVVKGKLSNPVQDLIEFVRSPEVESIYQAHSVIAILNENQTKVVSSIP